MNERAARVLLFESFAIELLALYDDQASMTDIRTRQASVRWSTEQEAIGLPKVLSTIDPTWFSNEVPRRDEGWSIICEFERTPAEQGNPSVAAVRYLVAEAPHEKLVVGMRLKLFERATGKFADLEILE